MILAGAGLLLALYFVVQEDYENAFLAAAGGAVCWLLNYRRQLRESLRKEDEQEQQDEESNEEIPS